MKRLKFETTIDAPREKVWQVLWNDKSYREWTKPFNPESHLKGDLRQGGRVLFLGNEQGTIGMYSEIEVFRPNERLAFHHLGELNDGREIPFTDSGRISAMEIYTLTETGGKTHLTVEVDMDEKAADWMNGVFPKGLEVVKELAEK